MADRVLVVDDHRLVREAVSRLLTAQGFEVVGTARDGYEALDKARELKPDVVLMDISMPGLDGISATRLIHREVPNAEVVLLTVSDREEDIVSAMEAGARGYVTKYTDALVLARQIRQVLSGRVGMEQELRDKLVTGLAGAGRATRAGSPTPMDALTEREREVLALVAAGRSNKELADTLYISENTVRAHVNHLMQKLTLKSRTQLAVYAVQHGLTAHTSQPDRG